MKYLHLSLVLLALLCFSLPSPYAAEQHYTGEVASGIYHNPEGDIVAGKKTDSDPACTIPAGNKVIMAPSGRLILKKGFAVKKTARFTGVIATTTDADSDNIHDWWEKLYGLNPSIADDAALDQDYDGLSNLEEFQGMTDPNVHEKAVISLFKAEPQAVLPGAAARLTWETRFTETCTITPGNGSDLPANGTALVNPSETTTYTLTAAGPGGSTTEEITITVNPALPRIVLNVFPMTIYAGATATLSWTVPGADTVSIDNGIGTVSAQGEASITPSQTTTYRLTAGNQEGQTSAEVTIAVKQPKPEIRLTASPIVVDQGQPVTLSWTSRYAETGSIDQGVGIISPENIAAGSIAATPGSGLTTYTMTVTGPGGTAQDSVITGDHTDTDSDGIPDAWEMTYGLDPADPLDASLDADGDLLTNKTEYDQGKDPLSYDQEDIILTGPASGTEVSGGTITVNPPASGETRIPSGNTLTLKANCKVVINPVFKVAKGARLVIRAEDCDKLPNEWEMAKFGTTEYSDDDDPDNDGLTNYQEYQINSDPLVTDWDTDDDGLNDAWELTYFNSLDQSGDMDSDNDGASNYIEQLTKSDPTDVYSIPKPGNYYEYDALGRIKRLIRIN